jgi:hypothetical protein
MRSQLAASSKLCRGQYSIVVEEASFLECLGLDQSLNLMGSLTHAIAEFITPTAILER